MHNLFMIITISATHLPPALPLLTRRALPPHLLVRNVSIFLSPRVILILFSASYPSEPYPLSLVPDVLESNQTSMPNVGLLQPHSDFKHHGYNICCSLSFSSAYKILGPTAQLFRNCVSPVRPDWMATERCGAFAKNAAPSPWSTATKHSKHHQRTKFIQKKKNSRPRFRFFLATYACCLVHYSLSLPSLSSIV